MALTAEQRSVIRRALGAAQKNGANPRELKALVEAMGVESNFRHLDYGDRDSVGVLQQRPSQGWGPAGEPVEKDVKQFLKSARQYRGQKGSAGWLAQSVQRSAFPERYDERSAQAERILRRFTGDGGTDGQTVNVAGVDNSEVRKQLLLGYLAQRGKPGALLGLADELKDARDQPGSSFDLPGAGGGSQSRTDGGGEANIKRLAKLAQSLGLHVGEQSGYGGVAPVHAEGSWHYKDKALDISGDPAKMAKFSRVAARRYGKDLEELFYNGRGGRNRKNGKKVSRGFVSGHTDHVHVADDD